MGIFPTTAGVRPRLACELRPGGAVAARADGTTGSIDASGAAEFAPEALRPGLAAGNIVDRPAVVAAIRRSLEAAGSNGAGRDITLIVPDAAARIILLEFETLPHKAAEALPVVRFRLRKLVPFEVDNASVSYQIMSSGRNSTRLLVVAMPSDVVAEYESAAREAGFEPGALLPSTIASLAGIQDAESSVLVVNASSDAVTAAIVQGGILLLHRPVELHPVKQDTASEPVESVESVESAVSPDVDPVLDPVLGEDPFAAAARLQTQELARIEGQMERQEAATRELQREIAQAVSIAVAYFEDNLGFRPETVLSAGALGADALGTILEGDGLKVRELVESTALAAGAASSSVRRGLLAGVRGALRG